MLGIKEQMNKNNLFLVCKYREKQRKHEGFKEAIVKLLI